MIRAVVLDDEAIIAADVAQQLNTRPRWHAEAVTHVDDALHALRQGGVDVLFLDIEMPGVNGVDLAATLKADFPHTDIVFVTAYPQYAVGAFRVSAVDYVLKPVARTVLGEACSRIEERRADTGTNAAAHMGEGQGVQKFVVRSFGRVDIVPVQDIVLVRAERNYVALVCATREYLYRATIGDIEQAVGTSGIVRCHRSYLVRKDLVASITRKNGVLTRLQLVGGHTVPVGTAYRAAIKEMFSKDIFRPD